MATVPDLLKTNEIMNKPAHDTSDGKQNPEFSWDNSGFHLVCKITVEPKVQNA